MYNSATPNLLHMSEPYSPAVLHVNRALSDTGSSCNDIRAFSLTILLTFPKPFRSIVSVILLLFHSEAAKLLTLLLLYSEATGMSEEGDVAETSFAVVQSESTLSKNKVK